MEILDHLQIDQKEYFSGQGELCCQEKDFNMSTIRIHRREDRPVLADSTVAYASDLSFGAKGLAVLIENEPDDFAVIPEEICLLYPKNSSREIQLFIDELITFGYLEVR